MTMVSRLCSRFQEHPAFTARDVRLFFDSEGVSSAYRNLLLHKLVAGKRLFRISKGIYTFRQEAQVVGFAFQPFYYGLQDALSLRSLWEQETVPVVLTPRKVRSGIRSFEGSNYIVRRISRGMFFGFETIRYGDFWIPVSDAEKTLIDLVYFRQPIGKELAAELKRAVRKKVLRAYLARLPPKLSARVKAAIR